MTLRHAPNLRLTPRPPQILHAGKRSEEIVLGGNNKSVFAGNRRGVRGQVERLQSHRGSEPQAVPDRRAKGQVLDRLVHSRDGGEKDSETRLEPRLAFGREIG